MMLPFAMVLTRARRFAAFRGEVFEADLGRFSRVFRYSVAHAHVVTVNAPDLVAEAVRWGADPRRIVFVPNGVDIPAVPAPVDQSPPSAVVVANFRWYKGHDVLVQALATLQPCPDVRLIGEGDLLPQVSELVELQGLSSSVTFVDQPADVAAELGRAQFAIHPSRTEGMSNAILEQMAAGLPVVATDVGASRDLIADGLNGFLVPAGDSARLADAIRIIASSVELRTSMGRASRARAEAFSWSTSVERYMRLFAPEGNGPR
jgi:glycosyltransferase involved in cell wall biosynthesis